MQFEEIKGFGAKRIQKLKEAGFNDPTDLLMVFPSKYVIRDKKITDFENNSEVSVIARCVSEPISKYVRKGLCFVKATFFDGQRNLNLIWFNQPYIKKQLIVGQSYAIVGKVKVGKNYDIYVSAMSIDDGGDIITIYRSYNGIPAKVFKEAIIQILEKVHIEGQIPEKFCIENGILPLNQCIKSLHLPNSEEELIKSRMDAALEILVFNITVFSLYKGLGGKKRANFYADNRSALNKVINTLPYKLTEDQYKTVMQIIDDLHSENKMNRLVEGDVGCGKTVVAFLVMYYAVMSGYQAALMAPTEILALQHYKKAVEFFESFGIKCELLCGSQKQDRRREALFNIKTGNAMIVIGTHAIFQDAVVFKNLALTIADEQHRFGVKQRGSLENKGRLTDTVVMSATPIPRTLALTLYGDLNISTIKTLPNNKAKIYTRFVPKSKESDMLDYVYKKSFDGEKTYIVCPRVDDEDGVSATDKYRALKKRYGEIVGLIHGQMKDDQKNEVMNDFINGKIKLLVCTTVIEVGIDVSDATNIIIYDAEMYGLSQLHQLRGRVGRGKKDSFCFVVGKSGALDDRLKYFINTESGFELAEYDFKIRGAGDFLGERQHGNDKIFSGVGVNEGMLIKAKNLSEKLISSGKIEIDKKTFDFIKGLTLN